MKRTYCFVIGMMMVSCLILAGCKKAREKAAEKAIESGMAKEGVKAKVDVSGEKITIQTKEGTTVFSGGKGTAVPEKFPKDVYVYEGATITAAISVPDGFNLAMETSDNADKVLGTIKSKMAGFGWKEEMTMNQSNYSMVSYKKGERTAMVNINSGKRRNKGSSLNSVQINSQQDQWTRTPKTGAGSPAEPFEKANATERHRGQDLKI